MGLKKKTKKFDILDFILFTVQYLQRKLLYKFNTQGKEQKGNTTLAQNNSLNLRIRLTLKQYSTYLQVIFP